MHFGIERLLGVRRLVGAFAKANQRYALKQSADKSAHSKEALKHSSKISN